MAVFLTRLRNFFRPPLAAADVPQGESWTRADLYDPFRDPWHLDMKPWSRR